MHYRNSRLSRLFKTSILTIPLLYGCSIPKYKIAGYEVESEAINAVERDFRDLLGILDTNNDNKISQEEVDAGKRIFYAMGGLQYIREKLSKYVMPEKIKDQKNQ